MSGLEIPAACATAWMFVAAKLSVAKTSDATCQDLVFAFEPGDAFGSGIRSGHEPRVAQEVTLW